jgi:hypothetical protein
MKSGQLDDGPIIIIVFGCLAVTLSLISFGLGFINLAKAKVQSDSLPSLTPVVSPHDLQDEEKVRADILALQKELEQLSAQIARSKRENAGDQDPGTAQNRLSALQSEAVDLQTQIAKAQSKLTDLDKEAAGREGANHEAEFLATDLKRQLDAAEENIKEVKTAIEDKQKMDVTKLGGSMKNPQYVECQDGEIVLQPQGDRISIQSIKSADSRFTGAVRRRDVFFLVRPTGFKSFEAALAAAQNLGATVGYEPVDADWPIKFR